MKIYLHYILIIFVWNVKADPNNYNGKILFYSNRINDSDIHIMDLDGSNQKKLYKGDYFDRGSPLFSPDGKKVVFQNTLSSINNTYIVSIDGTELQKLGTLEIRAFLPNGNGFICTNSNYGTITQTDLNGKNEKILFFTNRTAINPRVSRKGILFISKRNNTEMVYLGWDGKTQKIIPRPLNFLNFSYYYNFSGGNILFNIEASIPSHKKMDEVFVGEVERITYLYDIKNNKLNKVGNGNLLVHNKTFGIFESVSSPGDLWAIHTNNHSKTRIDSIYKNRNSLEITPNEKKIICSIEVDEGSNIFIDSNEIYQIYSYDIDGKGSIQLTTKGSNTNPVVTPDGNKIIFVSDRDGNKEIYSMDIDGSNQKNLTNNEADDVDPYLQPSK